MDLRLLSSSGTRPRVDRRRFLGGGLAAFAALGTSLSTDPTFGSVPADLDGGAPATPELSDDERRLLRARDLRCAAAEAALERGPVRQTANGDETELDGFVASFSKGLPHDPLGRVDPAAYRVLLEALATGDPAAFEVVPLGGYAKLANPQAALAFDLVGLDPVQVGAPPAPRFSSPEMAGEMIELYWRALARDVPFARYGDDPTISRACAELSRLEDFRGPRIDRRVTPGAVFRGVAAGDLRGPYISQFLSQKIPYLPMWVEQQIRTTRPGVDYLDRYPRWLALQDGALGGANRFVDRPLYVRSGRDLAEYVHRDFSYQAYLSACLMLFQWGVPADGGNPYKHSRTQSPFTTHGLPAALSMLAIAAQLALKASWFQKWRVHRRLRPEEMGGRVEQHLAGRLDLPLSEAYAASEVIAETFDRQGNRLLSSAYAEGCPIHPSYPAAHAVVAGACVTVLKAFFDEAYAVPDPVEATPDGRALEPWRGQPLTVGDELDKLASNIALGRDFAGVHYRSDSVEGVLMGERLALALLAEARATGNEVFSGVSVRRLDGRRVDV